METYVDLEELEPYCECMKSRTAYIYTYPFVEQVAKNGAKIMTRDGRVVKKVRMGSANGDYAVVGVLDGEELKWDVAGRFSGPYMDSPLDLRISERYFFKDWKSTMKMSNAEWYATHDRRHPTVKIPER